MKIMKQIDVPTGNICIAKGDKGELEFLSIGDYGKEKNLKADFLGLTNEINGVPHGDLLPLEEKWVITISSQYGCSMKCAFCDVPKVGKGTNATLNDLINQVKLGIGLNPEVTYTKRLNLHYARMGEPTFNKDVITSAYYLKGLFEEKGWGFHPVVSTMMPENNILLYDFIHNWIEFKNYVNGNAGLQISINTTNEDVRHKTMPYAMSIEKIGHMLNLVMRGMKGRKIALNFALTDSEIDAKQLIKYFDPQYFLCKITPMHITNACVDNQLITKDGYEKYYPYKNVEESLKAVGYDVIVFVPSKEEDESRITCGNAILSETMMS